MRPASPASFLPLVALVLAACQTTGAGASASELEGEHVLSVRAGFPRLDSDFEPADEPFAYGLHHRWRLGDGRYAADFGVQLAADDDTSGGTTTDTDVYEFYAGVRRQFSWAFDELSPYLSAGATFLDGEVRVQGMPSASGSDRVAGIYLEGGVEYAMAAGLVLSAGLRVVEASDLSFASGPDLDPSYVQPYLAAGFSF